MKEIMGKSEQVVYGLEKFIDPYIFLQIIFSDQCVPDGRSLSPPSKALIIERESMKQVACHLGNRCNMWKI